MDRITLLFKEKYFNKGDCLETPEPTEKPAKIYRRFLWIFWIRIPEFLFRFVKLRLVVLEEPIQSGNCWKYTVKLGSKKYRII